MVTFETSSAYARELARKAYEAYIANSGGKAWDGRPCPTWDELVAAKSPVCSHWCAAGAAVATTTGNRIAGEFMASIGQLATDIDPS